MDERALERAVAALRGAAYCVALTGAGISVDSGIPDFRSAGGLWERFPPERYAHIDAFRRDPDEVWRYYRAKHRLLSNVQPNAGHRALARLEERGVVRAVLTQNIDALHQAAGTRRVIPLHGDGWTLHCIDCAWSAPTEEHLDFFEEDAPAPRCPSCGHKTVKPAVVMFGEALDPAVLQAAYEETERADVMLVCGTTAQVWPAAGLPRAVAQRGRTVVVVDLHPPSLVDEIGERGIFVRGGTSEVLGELAKRLAA